MTWLDELEAKRAAMTQGEWSYSSVNKHIRDATRIPVLTQHGASEIGCQACDNAHGIVALVNESERLLRIARAAGAFMEASTAESDGTVWVEITSPTEEWDALRAALSEPTK